MHAERLVTLAVEGIAVEQDRPDVAVALLLQACTHCWCQKVREQLQHQLKLQDILAF